MGQIVEKDGLPMYDVEYKEKRALFSPDSISSLVYKKMMGKYRNDFSFPKSM